MKLYQLEILLKEAYQVFHGDDKAEILPQVDFFKEIEKLDNIYQVGHNR